MMHPTDEQLETMDAATMRRACKMRVSVDELAQIIRVVDGSNTLGAGALAEAILASLDPAPDHSDWNAAIEAAAKVVEAQPSWKWGLQWAGRELAAAIRQLKKEPRHDWRKHSTKTEDGYNG